MKRVLIITNRHDSHADCLIQKFHERRILFLRFNTDDFPVMNIFTLCHVGAGDARLEIEMYGEKCSSEDIRSVWYRRPLQFGVDQSMVDPEARKFADDEARAFTEGLWATIECRVVSPLHNIRRANHKILQLKVAKQIGFEIPWTLVTNDPSEFAGFWDLCRGEVIYKPMGQNIIRDKEGGIKFAYTNKLTKDFLVNTERIKYAPCLFQEYVDKQLELRITVVGDEVFTCEIHSQKSDKTKIDWRHYDIANTPHKIGKLPEEIEKKCVALVRHFGLEFGAIDMILTPGGEYKFIEINPNGQWLWIEELTGLPISEAMFNLLTK